MVGARHVIIGTAGHVDHGKTALVLALTGIDTDRLAEEKRRGITIENGFAHLTFPDGQEAGIIDVPGHERFVRHMLAGSGGIDIALLVVAADDGVMPQTREHLDILKLLGIPSAVVALSKCDLVTEPGWLELVTDDIIALTNGVFRRDPVIVPVSVQTGQGLDHLIEALHEMVLNTPPRPCSRFFRLPLDRVFTLPGFGTVVTGTLLDGQVRTGDAVRIYPTEIDSRIRQIQVHSREVDLAWPGQRVALNLAGLKKEDLSRGDVVATPGSLKNSYMLDAHLMILPDSPFALKNNRLVQLHLAAQEVTAKVVLMGTDQLASGESDYVQFRLTNPVVARRGDRLVVRLPSPAMTVGGGEILDACPQKHRRRKPEVLKQYQTKESGTLRQRLELAIRERPGSFTPLPQLILRADLGSSARTEANFLASKGVVFKLTPEIFLHQTEFSSLTQRLKSILAYYHQHNPFSPGLSTREIHTRLAPQAPPNAWEGLLQIWESEGLLVREEGMTRLKSFEPQVDEVGNQYIELLEHEYLNYGWTPLATSAVLSATDPDQSRRRRAALSTLIRRGLLIHLDDLYHMHRQPYEEAWQLFQTMSLNGPVEPGPFRDALKTSRKVAIAILENFETRALAVKSGPGRLPIAKEATISTLGTP